jgi:hypothetical protein
MLGKTTRSFLQCKRPLLTYLGRTSCRSPCPLSGVKQTRPPSAGTVANDPNRTRRSASAAGVK